MSMESSAGSDEGEIIESDSEKATKSQPLINGTNVDRLSSNRLSTSKSPDLLEPPQRYRSHSPYEDYRQRGEKRRREDDDSRSRGRIDPRRFKVHYEGGSYDDHQRRRVSYADIDRVEFNQVNPYETDVNGDRDRYRHKRTRTRSRSPPPSGHHADRRAREEQGRRHRQHNWDHGRGREEQKNRGSSRYASDYAVSNRTQVPVASEFPRQEAETQNQALSQTHHAAVDWKFAEQALITKDEDSEDATNEEPRDEVAEIERRRQQREAIRARYKQQSTSLLVQALKLGIEADGQSVSTSGGQSPDTPSTLHVQVSPRDSPPHPSRNGSGEESPTSFDISKGERLEDRAIDSMIVVEQDEPSAADYDPTKDMKEDSLRDDQRHHGEELSSMAYSETQNGAQDILPPSTDPLTVKEKPIKAKDEFDMFAEEDEDMFADEQAAARSGDQEGAAEAVPIPQAKELDMSMLDNWDDQEGYYKVILGELLDGRYHVQTNLGKGMFSGVVRAMDIKTRSIVAIKLIRNNETMKKAGLKEIGILQQLVEADPEDKKHLIRLERFFEHKNHLCMVFENLSINLREVLKKFGRDVGINLKAVRAYAQQMFLGLSLLKKCNLLHADLKPDNILVNEARNVLKICDLGSASLNTEYPEITPYLVSRFYRAPEIILGMPYDFAIDVWSIGCTLYELYTGKILFTGRSNNQMLRSIMECRGGFTRKMLNRGREDIVGLHFDDKENFYSVEKDKLTGRDVVRTLKFHKPIRDLHTRLFATSKGLSEAEKKELESFERLLSWCLMLDPKKRCTPTDALKHDFFMKAKTPIRA